MVSKWKRTIRRGYASYSLFHFWDLKLVPIDSALNFVSSKLTHSFQKCMCGTKKNSQTWESSPNVTKEEIEPWVWHIWIAQWLTFFPTAGYIFSISAIFSGKWVGKVETKGQTLGPSLFQENSNPSKFFCCLLENYLW